MLAIENAENLEITFNDEEVSTKVIGWYVDKAIKTVMLPCVKKGTNVLTVKGPLGARTSTESCYLLGDFNVRLEGRKAVIVEKTQKIGFGDIAVQGMPFYGGNIEYFIETSTKDCTLCVTASRYRGALIRAELDGKERGVIAYSPYQYKFDNVKGGKHTLKLTLFGNRFNTFGALHNTDYSDIWYGPNYWRSTDCAWSYEYNLKPVEILKSPVISEMRAVNSMI